MILLLTSVGSAIALLWFLLSPEPLPIRMVYQVPGKWYWLKFQLMKFAITRKQKKTEKQSNATLNSSGFGGDGKRDIIEMETNHEVPKDKDRAADAVFFDGANRDGWYITLGTAQRPGDVINLFFILRVPNQGTFVNEELLTNNNVKSISSKKEWRTASGFIVSCVEPMQKWRIQFKGKLTPSPGLKYFKNTGEETVKNFDFVDAEIDFEWTNFGDYFDFDREVSPTSIGHSIAIEKWSREMFKKLQDSHQTHYEQFGFLNGSLVIDGQSHQNIKMTSMRDHTVAAYRNWSDIRRYIMMIYHLEDGTCIHTSLISMPETVFSHLEFGYVITPDKRKIAVDRIHLHLSEIGEGKDFPETFQYSFDAGELHYDVEVNILESCSFKMGLDLATQVNENMATFTANGLRGWGFAECEYRITPY